jgi:hypothetical protein
MANVAPEKDTSSAPNPRSSGFVPIGTLKKDEGRRQSGIRERPHAAQDIVPSSPFARKPRSPKAESPSSDALNHIAKNQRPSPRAPAKKAEIQSSKVAPRLPAFPPTRDPEVKYDVRSARGGRGGRVAAVASIWASQTGDTKPSPPPARNGMPAKTAAKPIKAPPKKAPSPGPASLPPDTSVADLTARRARLIKSRSVPAEISSSHATPMLSSTASLARSTPLPDRRKTPIKLPPTVSESQPDISQSTSRSSTAADLAFGQARLRDLIKKYQNS